VDGLYLYDNGQNIWLYVGPNLEISKVRRPDGDNSSSQRHASRRGGASFIDNELDSEQDDSYDTKNGGAPRRSVVDEIFGVKSIADIEKVSLQTALGARVYTIILGWCSG
jgi:hypothetical protein